MCFKIPVIKNFLLHTLQETLLSLELTVLLLDDGISWSFFCLFLSRLSFCKRFLLSLEAFLRDSRASSVYNALQSFADSDERCLKIPDCRNCLLQLIHDIFPDCQIVQKIVLSSNVQFCKDNSKMNGRGYVKKLTFRGGD